jgi:hypothetical protein
LTEEERKYNKFHSDVRIPLFKNYSENGGIISKTDQNIALTVQNIALTVPTVLVTTKFNIINISIIIL